MTTSATNDPPPAEQRFIDAVLDHPVNDAVAAMGLRVRDVVEIAKWLAPVAASAEVDHWKGHAEEAGRGFARVCRDYARVSARNVRLIEGVEAWAVDHFGYMPPALKEITSPETRVHNHPPYRPVCNERRLADGQLRGACLNDDGSER